MNYVIVQHISDLRSPERGFSFIELVVAVGIISLLTAIAIPSFRAYQSSSYKAAAKSVLLEAAAREEQLLMQNRGYVTAVPVNDFSALGMDIADEAKRAYSYSIDAPATTSSDPALASMPTFRVVATPATGADLPTLSINQFGLRMPRAAW